jgi:hypothetical protein
MSQVVDLVDAANHATFLEAALVELKRSIEKKKREGL